MFKDYQQNQGQLLPKSLSDSISPDHTARLINQVIDEINRYFGRKMKEILRMKN